MTGLADAKSDSESNIVATKEEATMVMINQAVKAEVNDK
jgi:hypothetical protein